MLRLSNICVYVGEGAFTAKELAVKKYLTGLSGRHGCYRSLASMLLGCFGCLRWTSMYIVCHLSRAIMLIVDWLGILTHA